jgi:hypothetical protein
LKGSPNCRWRLGERKIKINNLINYMQQEENKIIQLLSNQDKPNHEYSTRNLKNLLNKNSLFVLTMIVGCVLLGIKTIYATGLIKPEIQKVILSEEEIIKKSINQIYESPRFQMEMKKAAERKYWENVKNEAEVKLNQLTKPQITVEKNTSSELPSQSQKDTIAAVCKRIGENRAEFYTKHNISINQFIDTCYYDLLAIAWKESRYNCEAKGDGNKSYGCFQIQINLHKLTKEQAENFNYAAEWTLDRMVRDYEYPRFRTAALARHNGSGQMAQNYATTVKIKSAEFKKMGL